MTSLIERMAFEGGDEVSLESSNVEYEVEIYLDGFDLAEIQAKATSRESQDQWGIYVPKTDKNATSGNIRVRKTSYPDDTVTYVMATKTELGEDGKDEFQLPTLVKQFEQFELLADQGLVKVRYTVPHELDNGIKFNWEVDVFYNKHGELVPWAKIDAEIEKGTAIAPTDIPFAHTELLWVTPEAKANNVGGIKEKVGALYAKYFRTENKHV